MKCGFREETLCCSKLGKGVEKYFHRAGERNLDYFKSNPILTTRRKPKFTLISNLNTDLPVMCSSASKFIWNLDKSLQSISHSQSALTALSQFGAFLFILIYEIVLEN